MARYRLGLSFLILIVLAFVASAQSQSICAESYRRDTVIHGGNQPVIAQVAASQVEKQVGLGKKSCLKGNQGMLFIFDKPGFYEFWMKDMRFPIDIVWINQDKVVEKVSAGVSPSTYPRAFQPDTPAEFVLELNSGSAKSLGLQAGVQLSF